MPDSGVLVIGDQIIGYSERYIYVNWDIAPDVCVEVQAVLEMPYLGVSSVRYVYHEHVKYSYSNKWCSILYTPIPVSDRYIYLKDFSLNDLKYYLSKDKLIILSIETIFIENKVYKYKGGHYIILSNIDKDNFVVQDPLVGKANSFYNINQVWKALSMNEAILVNR